MTGKPNDAPWLSPYFISADVARAIDFYERAFGFKLRMENEDEHGHILHAELTYQDQLIMVGEEGTLAGIQYTSPKTEERPSALFLYVYCEDVDTFYTHAVAQGAISLSKPADMPWQDRMCRLKDPDGYLWSWATSTGACRGG